jgi:phosphonate transport system substrate-binding protein
VTLVLGAVAYDPKVVTIWDGFRLWLRGNGLPFDYVLYTNYERQVEDLVAGRIQVAWNSPLAWVRARRLARHAGRTVEVIAMRDTDRDLTSIVVARGDGDPRSVAAGAVDSPQATLIPLAHLRAAGHDFVVRRFDVGVGLHGDHIGGERAAAVALASGAVDAACMMDANLLTFTKEGILPDGIRILAQTLPYDHCAMTAVDTAPAELVERFRAALRSMSYEDPVVRPLLDLEGLRSWESGRTSGYAQLEAAVDEAGFYDDEGRVTAAEYAP